MTTIIRATKNFTKMHMINSKNGIALKDMDGETIKVNSLAILEKVEENGEIKKVGVLCGEDVYTTISNSAIETIEDLIDIAETSEETETYSIKVSVRKAKSGRDFLALNVQF